VKRSAFAAAATCGAMLALGVGGALAAPLPGSQLTRWATRDGVSIPSPLAKAITKKLSATPAVATADASQASGRQQELQASDGVLTGISVSLSADGHTALVGSPGNTVGAAYVFVEHGGKWSEVQELDSPAGSATDSYGSSVALSGDGSTALVGAYSGGTTENGIVYAYSRKGDTYVLNGSITAPDGALGDEFGYAVSLSALGNVALIGAPDHNTYQGAAYVFVHGARSWSEQREFQDPGGAFDTYGGSVSEAADGLAGVVGAPFANAAQGAAYAVSELNGSQQALPAPASAAPFLYGLSVSINALGTRALVGSPSANLGDGAAFVFDNHGANWTQTQELTPSNPSGADAFGYAVALNYVGNGALVGATERNGTDGSAFTFSGYPTLTQRRELDDPVPGSGAQYGSSTAMDALGDQLLIGAPYQDGLQGAAWAVAN
jgi:FG-GAP repeat